MDELLTQVWFGNSLQAWLRAGAAFLATFTLLPLLRGFILSHRRRIAAMQVPAGVDLALLLIQRTSRIFLWAVALWVGQRFLDLPTRLERASNVAIVVIAWLQVAFWATAALRFALDRQRDRARAAGGEVAYAGSLSVILFIGQLAIFAIAALLALDNLGINITALVAGLGIGGIAIALAVQTVLGDVFASLSIALDKPFVVGDLLRVDDVEGSVERIGIKSTRLRSVTGEQIIIANADLLRSRVRNMGRMAERRILFPLAIAYETPRSTLERLPQLVADIVRAQRGARFEFCYLRQLGASALEFDVCYFVSTDPGAKQLEVIERINRGLLEALSREDIRLASAPRAVVPLQAAASPPASSNEPAPGAAAPKQA